MQSSLCLNGDVALLHQMGEAWRDFPHASVLHMAKLRWDLNLFSVELKASVTVLLTAYVNPSVSEVCTPGQQHRSKKDVILSDEKEHRPRRYHL